MKPHVADMSKALKFKYFDFSNEMTKAGLVFDLTSVARDYKEQLALFAQGRESLTKVNALRAIALMPPIRNDIENKIVTWTLNSKHIVNRQNETPFDDLSNAFDIILIKTIIPLKPSRHYDLKISVNNNKIPDYLEASEIGKKVGLIVGASFKNPDYPHYQV